ncbi:voltage-dependent calcium channel subunit alpha-2/delta-3-like isoform X2 [Macrobrachium nipponense]|uniref:voltage-dependent calcium channel subunit alpha-2/delta-3-like isoform X2 n=1 Tax=Macrobrachium nipponense TaxID=159736 RepID=UPI0030C848D1
MRHKVRWWDSLSMLQRWTALVIVFLACLPAILAVYDHDDDLQVPHTEVEHWANKIGTHLFYLSNLFAQYDEIRDNFRGAKVQRNDGLQLVKEMAEDVTNMMKYKIEAVKRIMNVAEEASLDQFTDDDEVDYYSAKKLNEYYSEDDKKRPGQLKEGYRELKLVPNSHFDGIPVNENFSSVHVPTNVYDKAPDVLRAIRWSGRLDRTFKSNYELDPTLSWQYFGSSSGFLRQYPATKWVLDERDPDLYDARLRSWYIEAANSAKDMVILLDVSGSMTGLNREIAKHVVLNILETLNENDFVNVYNFNNGTKELVPCFHNTLVQANLENIGEFKKALSQGETKDIANFTLALTTAFDLLHRKLQYNKSGQGSQCNQAIMLVTDGAPNQFEEIFAKYNWPHLQVRVFTYLIGRQEAAVRNLKWMACANKGYFVHVTTLAEVREQVLKYIPVMARPMVMYQTNHPHVWTGVYADIAHPRHGYLDPKQTDWLWEVRERKRQMDRTNNYRKLQKIAESRPIPLPDPSMIHDEAQVEKFLKYGNFTLTQSEIARIEADKERKGRRQRMRRDASFFTLGNGDEDAPPSEGVAPGEGVDEDAPPNEGGAPGEGGDEDAPPSEGGAPGEGGDDAPSDGDVLTEETLNQTGLRRSKRDVCFMIPKRIHDYDLKKRVDRMFREMDRLEEYYEHNRMGRREAPGLRDGYRLMTSVSIPVFDRRKTMNITERVLVNESIWIMRTREVRSANLLGVAGTDVPIREIEKLVPPYKLGVNGYSFMVNRNGYILYHPDLRPVHEEANAEVLRKSRDKRKWFQDILKPNYNSVDFAEVELFDKEDDLRSNDSELLALTMGRDYNNKLRRDLIEQRAVETLQDVKVHLDGMKRVVTRGQWYYTQKVEDTPFSLGIALPEKYGRYKVFGQIELSRAIQDPRSNRAMDHFSSGNWTLHPEWVYCEYKYDDGHHNLTPEQLMTDFLSRAQKPHWKWRSTRTRPLPEPSLSHTSSAKSRMSGGLENERRENYYCDKDLIQSLLFDARATNVYFANKKMFEDSINGDRNPMEMYMALLFSSTKRHITGITTSFVATRSGLTRWFDIPKHNSSEDPKIQEGLPHFMQVHNRAIDEVWYKRAVDYYEQDPLAYVYSVPFDAATQDPGDVLVVATRAIFIEENNSKKAPAAVVGVTIKHSQFVEYFINETSKCPSYPSRDNGCKDGKTCSSPHLDCYLLDDNGFIIASDKKDSTGKFFGTIEGTIMESLVQSEVYKRVRILDYQAVCLDSDMEPSSSSILYTPVQMIKWSFNWIVGNIFWLMVKTHLYTLWDPNEAWAYTHVERDAQYPVVNEPSPDYPDHKEYSEPRVERAIPDYMADEATAIEEVVADYEPPDFSGDAAEDESESSGESSGEGSGSEPEEASGEPPVPEYDVMDVMDTYDTDVGSGSGDGDADPEAVLTEYDDILEEIYDDGFPDDSEPYEDYDNVEKSVAFPSLETPTTTEDIKVEQAPTPSEEKKSEKLEFPIELAYINKTKPRPCDKEVNLYILQNNKLKQDGVYKPVKGKLSNCHANGCGRPFSVQKVKSTNLILVAVNNQCKCESRNVDIEPAEVDYNETMHCNRLLLSHFRRRPQNCYNYHPEETEIKLCGGAGSLGLPSLTMLISLVLAHMCYTLKLHS